MKAAAVPVQLEFELPLDPVQLARLSAPERNAVYRSAELSLDQIEAAETATRLVIAEQYRTAG